MRLRNLDTERKHPKWREFFTTYWRVVVLLALIVWLLAVIGFAFRYNANQRARVAQEQRVSTYALCVVQNINRAATRRNTIELYGQVTDQIRFHRHEMTPEELKIKKARAARLEKFLNAQRPLNCTKYVRPDIPAVTGGTT